MGNPMYLALCALLAVVNPDDCRGQLRELGDGAGRAADARDRGAQGPRGASRPAHWPTPERVGVAERWGRPSWALLWRKVRCYSCPRLRDLSLCPQWWDSGSHFCVGRSSPALGPRPWQWGLGLVAGALPGLCGGALSARGRPCAWGRVGWDAPAPRFGGGAIHGHRDLADHDAADLAPSRLHPEPPPRGTRPWGLSRNRWSSSHNLGLTSNQARTFKTELLQDSRIATVSPHADCTGWGFKSNVPRRGGGRGRKSNDDSI